MDTERIIRFGALTRAALVLGVLSLFFPLSMATAAAPKAKQLQCANTDSFNYGRVSLKRVGDEYIVELDATRLFEPNDGKKARAGGAGGIKLVFPADGCKWSATHPQIVECTRPDSTIVDLSAKEAVNPSWLRFQTELVTRVTVGKTESKLEAKYWLGPIVRDDHREKPLRGVIEFKVDECTNK